MSFQINPNWRRNAEDILADMPKSAIILDTLFSVLKTIERNNWQGACHVTCAVAHVLLAEQGIQNHIVLGEARIGATFFNHSWIEIQDQVVDMAIGNTLINGFNNPPVIMGRDVSNMKDTQVFYGENSGLPDDPPTLFVKTQTIGSFLNSGPIHPTHGFWILVIDIAKRLGLQLDLNTLKTKYSELNWEIK